MLDRRLIQRRARVMRGQHEHAAPGHFLEPERTQHLVLLPFRIEEPNQLPPRMAVRPHAIVKPGVPRECVHAIAQPNAGSFHPLERVRVLEDVEHDECSRHRTDFPTERVADEHILELAHDIASSHHAADRVTIPHRLPKRRQVRHHAEALLRATKP